MPPLRGRRGWERRVDEQVARETADRATERLARAATAVVGGAGPGLCTAPDRHGPGRRLPDLSGLPPLLAGSGAFEDLGKRLGAAGVAPPPSGTWSPRRD